MHEPVKFHNKEKAVGTYAFNKQHKIANNNNNDNNNISLFG